MSNHFQDEESRTATRNLWGRGYDAHKVTRSRSDVENWRNPVNDDELYYERIFTAIDSSAKGAIIGRGGYNIRDIGSRYDTDIRLRNFRNGCMDVHITGTEENIDLTIKEIMYIVNKKANKGVYLPAPFKTKIINIPATFYSILIELEQWITSSEATTDITDHMDSYEIPIRLSYYHVRRIIDTAFGNTLTIEMGATNKTRLANAMKFVVECMNSGGKTDCDLVAVAHNGKEWRVEEIDNKVSRNPEPNFGNIGDTNENIRQIWENNTEGMDENTRQIWRPNVTTNVEWNDRHSALNWADLIISDNEWAN